MPWHGLCLGGRGLCGLFSLKRALSDNLCVLGVRCHPRGGPNSAQQWLQGQCCPCHCPGGEVIVSQNCHRGGWGQRGLKPLKPGVPCCGQGHFPSQWARLRVSMVTPAMEMHPLYPELLFLSQWVFDHPSLTALPCQCCSLGLCPSSTCITCKIIPKCRVGAAQALQEAEMI